MVVEGAARRRREPHYFTFSLRDVWAMNMKRRGGIAKLWLLLLLIILIQAQFLRQSTIIDTTMIVTRDNRNSAPHRMPHVRTSSSNNQNISTTRKPRVLIGIFSDLSNERVKTKNKSSNGKKIWGETSKTYRNRHRALFHLWSDKRLCSLTYYKKSRNSDCVILYTFILAGHGKNSTKVSSILLEDSPLQPLEILREFPNVTATRDLVKHQDYSILNIRENMNDGKTPTFLAWAKITANALDIPYVAKCDSDAILRLGFLLRFIYKDLAWNPKPASTLLGTLRHKAFWNQTAAKKDESFWKTHYHNGMHLYLGGEFYLMSTDLIDGLSLQAQDTNRSYYEGHEDHDALSMIQVSNYDKLIRWICMPRNYRFWAHPVKGITWWKRILDREKRLASEGNLPSNTQYHLAPLPSKKATSILLIVGAMSPRARNNYRKRLLQQTQNICSLDKFNPSMDSSCDLFYIFVMGGNSEGKTEQVRGREDLVLPNKEESDLLLLNIRDNIHEGLGQTALHYLHSHFKETLKHAFDMVLFCQAGYMLSVPKWKELHDRQAFFPRNLLVGDLRDKDQQPREFGPPRGPKESYFYFEQENIHLYMGSDACFALSTDLVSGILELARAPNTIESNTGNSTNRKRVYPPRVYFENNLGHDLTTLAYQIPNRALHWLSVPQTFQLWSPVDT